MERLFEFFMVEDSNSDLEDMEDNFFDGSKKSDISGSENSSPTLPKITNRSKSNKAARPKQQQEYQMSFKQKSLRPSSSVKKPITKKEKHEPSSAQLFRQNRFEK